MLIHEPTPAMTAITATSRMAKSTVYSISEAPFSSDLSRLRNLIIEDMAALLHTVLIGSAEVIFKLIVCRIKATVSINANSHPRCAPLSQAHAGCNLTGPAPN